MTYDLIDIWSIFKNSRFFFFKTYIYFKGLLLVDNKYNLNSTKPLKLVYKNRVN